MKSIWRWIAVMYSLAILHTHWYKWWSHLYRWVWQRKFRDVKIITFTNLDQLAPFMKSGALWVHDSWEELFDAVGSPQYAQQVFSGAEPAPAHGLDCDEHAIFLTAAIQKSIETGVLVDSVYAPRMFSVLWFDGWMPNGHNVCLLELPLKNGAKQYGYMDYGSLSIPCNSIQEVADLVRRSYGKGDVAPLVWSVSDLDLTPQIITRG